jgi:hypothetical protein
MERYEDILQLKIHPLYFNDPDLVQAFLKKWWVESDFKAPNLPLSYSHDVFFPYFI